MTPSTFLPVGGKRSRAFLALRHLHDKAPAPVDLLPLAPGAPFGRLAVDTAGCTLCLACVSACPTGALLDDENRPWLGFREEACGQARKSGVSGTGVSVREELGGQREKKK